MNDDDPRLDRSRLSFELLAAMVAYHDNRKNQEDRKWDKQADLDAIFAAAADIGAYCMASVGNFTIDWPDGTRSVHDEGYLEDGRIDVVKDENGVFWRLRDFVGKMLPEPEEIVLKAKE